MAEFHFENLAFKRQKDKVHVKFLSFFKFDIDMPLLLHIAPVKIKEHSISFECHDKKAENQAEHQFLKILEDGFSRLIMTIDGHRAIYVHRNSGIPIIGSNSFGIVDRNTSCIEVKPITGCNLTCIYCSVDEGINSKKQVNFVVESEYLVEEIKKVISAKKCQNIEVHIGTKGEPLLYASLDELIKGISAIPEVKTISMDTNATLLNKKRVDKLIKSGLTRFNISLNAISKDVAREMAGCTYSVKPVIEIIEYITARCDIIIAPVWVPGINDSEIPKLIEFALHLKKKNDLKPTHPIIGIQNYLAYKHGRNPAKPFLWEDFYAKLSALEKKYNTELILDGKKHFGIVPTAKLEKPFKKGDIVEAEIKCIGPWKGEVLAAAKSRVITVINSRKKSGRIKVKILRSKHNVFLGIAT